MRRLQRTAWTTPRREGWLRRLPWTTGALAVGLQTIMSAVIIAEGSGVWAFSVAAIGLVGVAFNVRNSILTAMPAILTLVGAAGAFGTGWASVPVLGAFGFGSWVVSYLIERTKNGRRENYDEPLAAKNDVVVAGSIAGATAVISAVVFALTLLPKVPLVFAVPVALLVASVAVVALGSAVLRSRANSPGNEDFFRVGTQLDAKSSSQVVQMPPVRPDAAIKIEVPPKQPPEIADGA